jgi:hypothetical protein
MQKKFALRGAGFALRYPSRARWPPVELPLPANPGNSPSPSRKVTGTAIGLQAPGGQAAQPQ